MDLEYYINSICQEQYANIKMINKFTCILGLANGSCGIHDEHITLISERFEHR
jgi:hypothetical protein